MRFRCEGRCGLGKLRGINQDNIYVNGRWRQRPEDPETFLVSDCSETGVYGVFDGMGGGQFGEEASLLAVKALDQIDASDFFQKADAWFWFVNREICRLMESRDMVRIGTTAVIFTAAEGRGRVVNMGDSRAYFYRQRTLKQLSRDHTRARQMADIGLITEKEAAVHPKRHVLTQHLGIFPDEMIIEPYISEEIRLEAGDLALLCSDGLTDMLTEKQLQAVLGDGTKLSQKADMLYQLAMDAGGRDNISVVLVQAEE